MKILILGGTRLIGRHIAATCIEQGDQVTLFNRGRSPDDLPAHVERLRGDRDQGAAGLEALANRTWDACIDVSGYTAIQVRASAELLRDQVRRYLYISSVSAYGDPDECPVYETAPLLPDIDESTTVLDQETYGRLKATCERIVTKTCGHAALIFRPQVVTGPRDASGRYAFWVKRAERTTPMLAPGDGSDYVQVIDVRDLARFARHALENEQTGAFNLAGPRFTWKRFIALLGVANPVWIAAKTLLDAGLSWRELPLFRPEKYRSSLMDVENTKARQAGLTLTDPADTLRDFREWMKSASESEVIPPDIAQEHLSFSQEQEIIQKG